MKWIEANGVVLRYELSQPASQTVILLHEAGGSIESWDAVMPDIQQRHRTLRYDQRGFGMSERASVLSLEIMVNDLVALLDALQITEPCHLAGMAIGGSIAMAFAAAHPNRVASVIATSPVTGGLPESAKVSLEQRAVKLQREGMRSVVDASLQRSYPMSLRQDACRFEQYRGRFLANDPCSFAALSRAFLTLDLSRQFSNIQCPTLLVGCEEDGIKPASECEQVAALLPDGHYVKAASGHFIAVQTPDLFVKLMQTFLESLRAEQ
jgi:3-oxoadipate enol-lactonase